MIVLIALSIFLTSLVSGVLGMAGGMMLMGVLGLWLPVASAMVLHGVVQASANGSRAFLLRQHIRWQILPRYLAGAVLAYFLLNWLRIVPSKKVLFLTLGSFPLLALALHRVVRLDIMRKSSNVIAGFVVTATQILAGASGPILDVFYLNSSLNRHEIVASKAITQTLGHLLKLFFYAQVILESNGESFRLNLWILPVAIVLAICGTDLGKTFLQRLSERQFQLYSRIAIVLIGLVYIWQGFSY